MDTFKFGYSLKNIPLPTEEKYTFKLFERTEWFLKQMRWKAIFFDPEDADDDAVPENHSFRSRNSPQQVPELINFEKDLLRMISTIKSREIIQRSTIRKRLLPLRTHLGPQGPGNGPQHKVVNLKAGGCVEHCNGKMWVMYYGEGHDILFQRQREPYKQET